jgi:hypothetical protein
MNSKMEHEYIRIASNTDFQEFITDLMLRMGLQKKDMDLIFPKENPVQCRLNYGEFAKCMVAKSVDPIYNYEVYELVGDACINTEIVVYLFKKINGATVSRTLRDKEKGIVFRPRQNVTDYFNKLKAKVIQSKDFHEIASRLGFEDFLQMGPPTDRHYNPINMLADSLEAFVGCFESVCSRYLVHHYSHSYVSHFIDYIMDSKKINYHPRFLYDDITLLKETNDAFRNQGLPMYLLESDGQNTFLQFKTFRRSGSKTEYVNSGRIEKVGTNFGNIKGNKEMSKRALEYLKEISEMPKEYRDASSPDYGNDIQARDIKKAPLPEDFGIEDLIHE